MAAGSDTGKKPLAKVVRVLLLGVAILVFVGIGAGAGKPAAKRASGAPSAKPAEPAPQRENAEGFSAILFVNELSCPCTREKCRVAETCLQALKEDFSNRMRFETIDYELQHEKAKPLMEKYDAVTVPVLVVVDRGGNMLWRCEDFSDENAVRSRLENLIGKAELETKKGEVSADRPVQVSDERNSNEKKTVQDAPGAEPDRVIAYYLHTSRRCPTCLTIEAYTEEALKEKFAEALKSGKLVWRSIDVTLPENKHFIDDYQIVAQSVVLSDVRDGEQKKWKNLDKVWKLVRDKQGFFSYIQAETAEFLEQ